MLKSQFLMDCLYILWGTTYSQNRKTIMPESITHNGITVYFKTPEVGTGGGEYDWLTYYTDEEEKTDVKVEFGFVNELPQLPEGSRCEDCELRGKEMLYEITYVPFEDEYGDVREQEQLFAYWQLADDTYFMVVATGLDAFAVFTIL